MTTILCTHRRLVWMLLLFVGIILVTTHVYDQVRQTTLTPGREFYYQHLPKPEVRTQHTTRHQDSEANHDQPKSTPHKDLESTAFAQYAATTPEPPKNKTKVLFMTYMRGGSTLLSEMLNQHPGATLWFEPIDGVYSELYASVHGWFPLDILYNTDGTIRRLPDYEESAILQQFNNIMTCNIDAMTTDMLGHFAMIHITQKRFSRYIECLEKVNQDHHISAWGCKYKVTQACPRYFTRNMTSCYYCLHVPSNASFYSPSAQNINWENENYMNKHCKKHQKSLHGYANCMIDYRTKIKQCTPILKATCDNSNIVGAKTIRLRADTVLKLMESHPDLKLVYQMRDPRGVTWSRKMTGLLSYLSGQNITNEAVALCQRMMYEQDIMSYIQKKFKGRVLRVRYEDLVKFPLAVATDVFKLIGETLPKEVALKLRNSVHSEKGGNYFSTARKNGTESIDKWRKYIKDEELDQISTACSRLLKLYRYPVS